MEVKRVVEETVNVDCIVVYVPIRYEERQDFFKDFPLYDPIKKRIVLYMDLDAKRIRNWGNSKGIKLHEKVCDEGTYRLMSGCHIVAEIIDNYVPDVVTSPGSYGDYVIMEIFDDGSILLLSEYNDDRFAWNPSAKSIEESFNLLRKEEEE